MGGDASAASSEPRRLLDGRLEKNSKRLHTICDARIDRIEILVITLDEPTNVADRSESTQLL